MDAVTTPEPPMYFGLGDACYTVLYVAFFPAVICLYVTYAVPRKCAQLGSIAARRQPRQTGNLFFSEKQTEASIAQEA